MFLFLNHYLSDKTIKQDSKPLQLKSNSTFKKNLAYYFNRMNWLSVIYILKFIGQKCS